MKKKALKIIWTSACWILAIILVIKLSGPALLKTYVQIGVGNCQQIPILCMAPNETITNPAIDEEYIRQLLPYQFPKIAISAPKGFALVQETIKKPYYKKTKHIYGDAIFYLLYEKPAFFINLFPQSEKLGIRDNYSFLKHVMYAKQNDIRNLSDAFFVIMKSIFIPNLGEQKTVKMAEFNLKDKRGFINYNLTEAENYFDCNVINNQDDFFKVYIKDKGASLKLEEVLAIITTLKAS